MPEPPSFLRLRPAPAPPSTDRDVSPTTHDANVLSRLGALFTSHSPVDGTRNAPCLDRARTLPPPSPPIVSPGTFVDRTAIKVLVVTWNMGDELPKGDLTVLLGEVPQYTAPASKAESIPSLPVENKHPYHIVVVAGQECPTDSGVPRGLAGGIMKGVHSRHSHRKEKEEKKKAQEDEQSNSGPNPMFEFSREKGEYLETDEDKDLDEESRAPTPSSTPTPTPNTPTLAKQPHITGQKGWSTMLDDWFCGPVPTSNTIPGGSISSQDASSLPNTTSPSPVPMLQTPSAPALMRSSTAPGSLSPTQPMHFPERYLAAPTMAFAHSPLARSASSSASDSSASSPDEDVQGAFRFPPPASPGLERRKGASLPIKKDRPAIVIPNDEPERTRDGGKCYLHLVKERLMGMYLSIYVYKGCEHLIQGVDKDFVTAGLAGGRLGNKGGIGISLKLADHRFLFVNSHLAAHSARVSARLANIQKIKQELRLDCFLPKDDPRAASEDLTDRFDSVFWCGDLNFRLDLSRLHAEWLVEQKKYSEALMWDQLRAVMRDPTKNPFPGFEEGTIDFPPTFKYDVWRSVKATNRELRRSLRRRGTLDSKARRPSAVEGSPRIGATKGLSHVPEVDIEAHEELAEEVLEPALGPDRISDEDTRTIASRRSFESTAGGYTSGGHSTAGTDAEDEDYPKLIDASAYGSRHKALEVALKEKTKKFLSLVKMDKALSSSPSRKLLSASKRLREKPSQEFDASSRRTSLSSIASLDPPTPITDQGAPRLSSSTDRAVPSPLGGPRRPSEASALSSSPNQPVARRFSALKRSISGRSSIQDGRSGDSHELGPEDIDDNVDYREGVYDSSKKQRVPSWCDRVLWKTQVIPDPEEHDISRQLSHDSGRDRGSRAFNRLSHAFTNLGGHLRLSMTRTGSIDPHDRPNLHLNKSLPSQPLPEPEPTETLVASPEISPSLQATSNAENGEALVPAPRRAASAKSPTQTRLLTRSRSGSNAPHPLLDADVVTVSPPAFPKITFDPALPAHADRSSQNTTIFGRPRANSDNVASSSISAIKRSLSSSSNRAILNDSPPRRIGQRSSSGGSLKIITDARATEPPSRTNSTPFVRPAAPQHLSTGQINLHTHEDRNSIVKFFKEIPTWLHARSISHAEPAPSLRPPQPDFAGPKRHLKGEVECLHYGTIDDNGMRQLEGRSDHRPAIFAAAVYVGD